MAIDAIINLVTKDGSDLILELMARELDGIAGQDRMRIKNYTHMPKMGQEIWGNAGQVVIEPGEGIKAQRWYRRDGLIRLLEDF